MQTENEAPLRTITIRNMPRELEQRIETMAREEGASLAQTVIQLLLRATGLKPADPTGSRPRRHHDLDELAGTWSEDEAAAFERALDAQRRVDPEIWRQE